MPLPKPGESQELPEGLDPNILIPLPRDYKPEFSMKPVFGRWTRLRWWLQSKRKEKP